MRKFKLLLGGKARQVTVRGVTVSVIPYSMHPLPVDVRVFEEDTHLILTVDPVMRFKEEHPIRLLNSLDKAKPHKPGSVVNEGKSWYAVVHDLDAKETCNPEWVNLAYRELLRLAGTRRIQNMGIPLLGSVHGNMKPAESLHSLLQAISSLRASPLRHLMILVKSDRVDATRKLLIQSIRKTSG